MPDYKQMYFLLFNAVTDTIEVLHTEANIFKAALMLSEAQCKCEELYINCETESDPAT